MIPLTNDEGDSAEIDSFGAELMAWRASGVDLVWAKDPKVWDQSAPILFPVVGWTRDGTARVNGKTYPLSLHGFAWKKQFAVAERRRDFLRLELAADEETRALYPFEFRLAVEFRLLPGGLENALIVTNSGGTPLPYACGLHPAIRWPFGGSTGAARHCVRKARASGSSDHRRWRSHFAARAPRSAGRPRSSADAGIACQ